MDRRSSLIAVEMISPTRLPEHLTTHLTNSDRQGKLTNAFVGTLLARPKAGSKYKRLGDFERAGAHFRRGAARLALTIAKGPLAILSFGAPEGLISMQTVLLSCLFGGACTIVLWIVSAVDAERERMLQRGTRLSPREEI